MDTQSERTLAHLIRGQRVAALGTLRDGAPLVSMVLFATAPDFAEFFIHVSALAQHTQDMRDDPRVSLMIAATDDLAGDPQQLPRISLRGVAMPVPVDDPGYPVARATYLAKFPQSAILFGLGDFILVRIRPTGARYVAGFARAFNLGPAQLQQVSGLP